MQATLAELAALVGGNVLGDPAVVITGAAPLTAAAAGEITLVDPAADRHYRLAPSRASAVVVSRTAEEPGLPAIRVDDVHAAFAALVRFFRPPRERPRGGVSPGASVHPSAQLAADVEIHAFATIDRDVTIGSGTTIYPGVHVLAGARIGQGVTIFPNAVLYEDTCVGDRCVIHANAVLGAYGFGYGLVDGRHLLAAQLGNVVVEDDVEIGAGTTIDRGTYGPTVIGEGTKIDNQVMIAHNCRIGRHNMLCSQVGIAGSTTTGDYVVMAGQVGVRDHVHVGDRAVLGAMAGVINDVAEGSMVIGIPATPEREQKLKQAAFSRLPEMRRQLKQLAAAVERLTAQTRPLDGAASQDRDQDEHRAVA